MQIKDSNYARFIAIKSIEIEHRIEGTLQKLWE